MYDRIYKFNPELVSNKSEEGFIEFVENHNKKVIDFFSNGSKSKLGLFFKGF